MRLTKTRVIFGGWDAHIPWIKNLINLSHQPVIRIPKKNKNNDWLTVSALQKLPSTHYPNCLFPRSPPSLLTANHNIEPPFTLFSAHHYIRVMDLPSQLPTMMQFDSKAFKFLMLNLISIT